jgi:hypothetical protein
MSCRGLTPMTSPLVRISLVIFIRVNPDIFTRQPSDMAGIHREVIEVKLMVNPNMRPIKQNTTDRQLNIRI